MLTLVQCNSKKHSFMEMHFNICLHFQAGGRVNRAFAIPAIFGFVLFLFLANMLFHRVKW